MSRNQRIPVLADDARAGVLALVCDRFGFPTDVFDDFELLRQSDKYVSILRRGHTDFAGVHVAGLGIPFLRTHLRHPKLTAAAAMLFGAAATRNVVPLDPRQASAFVARSSLRLSSSQLAHCTGLGYVLVRVDEMYLGVGLLYPDDDGGRLESLFPRAWSPGPLPE